ncbi:MAG: ATP synthase subunit I [Candidatus Lambdaproteobacteria bacterium]|nr:ATP synthase subunit I [Candidatus Lambdaproteobacteria bacterium]
MSAAQAAPKSAPKSALGRGLPWLLLAFCVAISAAAQAWRGVDFARGVLIGSAVVTLNFIWTGRVVAGILERRKAGAAVLLTLAAKLGLSALALYLALIELRVEPSGVLAGLTAALAACIAAAVLGRSRAPR